MSAAIGWTRHGCSRQQRPSSVTLSWTSVGPPLVSIPCSRRTKVRHTLSQRPQRRRTQHGDAPTPSNTGCSRFSISRATPFRFRCSVVVGLLGLAPSHVSCWGCVFLRSPALLRTPVATLNIVLVFVRLHIHVGFRAGVASKRLAFSHRPGT